MSSMVEGIGDELLWAVGALCMVLLALPLLLSRFRQVFQMEIHPESQQNVQTARNHLQRHESTEQIQQPNSSSHQTPSSSSHQAPSNAARAGRRREGDPNCPICITALSFPVETNCGHIFCGKCMISYWEHGRWLGAVHCPICRQNVTIMLLSFNEEEQQNQSEDREFVVTEINRYNRRFSGQPRTVLEILQDLPMLLRHCVAEFFSMGGLVWMFRLRIIVLFIIALLYFISPLDIIPEAAFGFLGLIDDFFIFLLLAIYVSVLYRNYVAARDY